MAVDKMVLKSSIGGFGCFHDGFEMGQTFTLHRDGRMRLSRHVLDDDHSKEVMFESISKRLPEDVAADILDLVESSTRDSICMLTDVGPWSLVLNYEDGSKESRMGDTDVELDNPEGTLSEYIRSKLASAPVDIEDTWDREAFQKHAGCGSGGAFL